MCWRAGTACKPYAALFEEGAWKELAELFRKDLYRLHSMPLESQLSIHLQVTTCTASTPCQQGACLHLCEPALMIYQGEIACAVL